MLNFTAVNFFHFRMFSDKKFATVVYLITLICGISTSGQSQNLPVGHLTTTFTDPARGDRPLPCELYYPALTAGENTPVATGLFPVLVFGHGFQMGYDSYAYFKNSVVPDGYVLVFPKTETSLAPNHQEYGTDLAFLVTRMKTEGSNPASPFYGHIDSTSAIMGHSMGGGASFLGCENNTEPTAMVTWAAAETNPSAISAAGKVTIPTLVIAAGLDCVTPPATNQVPMYDSLASGCKVYISIKGGGHCYFADANFICSLGELGCPAFTISREQQHATTLDFTKLFLDHHLKSLPGAWTIFNDSLNSSPRITFQKSCTTTSVFPADKAPLFRVTPNPASESASISGTCKTNQEVILRITDIAGKKIFTAAITPAGEQYQVTLDMNSWRKGVYFAEICDCGASEVLKLIKN
jgi:pimeloyl-ACP methyl ester carboxylesterase